MQVRPVRQSRRHPDPTMHFSSAMPPMKIRRSPSQREFLLDILLIMQHSLPEILLSIIMELAEEDDLITGTADSLDNAVSNEM